MTAIQKIVIAALGVAAAFLFLHQGRQVSELRQQVEVFKAQQLQQTDLSNQVQELQRERDRATSALAALSEERAAPKKSSNEVVKLRGEVGRLRKENTEMGSSSGLSKVTASPEMRKMLRDQQKLGMSMIYKGFAPQVKLTTEQTEQLNDLLADHIMDNVDRITTVLRDKPAPEQVNQVFDAQETALREQVQALLGPEAFGQYQDYTRNLLGNLTAQQFKGQLTGDEQAKGEKLKQFSEVLQQETQAALAAAGLPADYQAVPMLNLRNIASEQEGERNLKLLDDIYQRTATRGSAFLSPEELANFQTFRGAAIDSSRAALKVNRTLMAPIAE